jgi:hypothetical protein
MYNSQRLSTDHFPAPILIPVSYRFSEELEK